MDIRKFFDHPYLKSYDLDGKDCTVTIDRIVQGEVVNQGGKKPMPFAYFVGKKKPLGLNPTNVLSLKMLYGSHEDSVLAGKKITLFPTKTQTKDGVQDCIRIRNKIPE